MKEGGAAGRNFVALAGDIIFFGIGMSFASQSTVLPSFLAKLTSSPAIIGLASTFASGAWLLPQMFAANAITGKPVRKPWVMGFGSASRCLFFAIIPLVLLLGPSRPTAVLIFFFTFYTLFWVFDGIASVGWLDILGKCLTVPSARGSSLSARQGERRLVSWSESLSASFWKARASVSPRTTC
jgi:hypothetical protein